AGSHFDDARVFFAERGVAGVMRILPVQARADLPEPRAPVVETRRALHGGALDMRPVVGVEVDGHRAPRVLGEVHRLAAVGRRGVVDLAVRHHLAHRDEMRHAARVRAGHATDPFAVEPLRDRFLELHRVPAFAGSRANRSTASITAAGCSSGMKWPEPGTAWPTTCAHRSFQTPSMSGT